jgi:SOS response regulatory protein OraA/RecX
VTTVTALHAAGPGRVAIEIEGVPWRVVPLDVAAAAGVERGTELDRPRLRALRRELRRAEAVAVAARALRARDRSRHELDERLESSGVSPAQRREALAMLVRAGLADDERFARSRAAALAERGRGDIAIRCDLEGRGVPPGLIDAALTALEPERERAARLVAARGPSPRTARALAAAGFGEEALEAAVGEVVAPDA